MHSTSVWLVHVYGLILYFYQGTYMSHLSET